MKKILFIVSLFISVQSFSQDSISYKYELQGNGVDSWVKIEYTKGVVTNKYMVYEDPYKPVKVLPVFNIDSLTDEQIEKLKIRLGLK